MVQTPTESISAFPRPDVVDANGRGIREGAQGMTLRDYLAATALNGILANSYQRWVDGDYRTDGCVIDAYEFADAMLAASEQVQS